MKVIVVTTPAEAGRYAADMIRRRWDRGWLDTLGVATGSSPLPVYEALADPGFGGCAHLNVFALDEYVGLPQDHPESFRAVVDREVTQRLGLDPARVHVPDGSVDGLSTAGSRYEEMIQASGGIDLQILGIGSTGHIGFNEPGSSLTSRTRVKTLSEKTRKDNSRFFPSIDQVPYHCVTQGLGTIMEAREVLLVATGAAKAAAVRSALEGPVTTMCPGSILQMHPAATAILDEAAAQQLTLLEYHRFTHRHRPNWQE